jgi:hypothetical protein
MLGLPATLRRRTSENSDAHSSSTSRLIECGECVRVDPSDEDRKTQMRAVGSIPHPPSQAVLAEMVPVSSQFWRGLAAILYQITPPRYLV